MDGQLKGAYHVGRTSLSTFSFMQCRYSCLHNLEIVLSASLSLKCVDIQAQSAKRAREVKSARTNRTDGTSASVCADPVQGETKKVVRRPGA